MKLTKEQLLDAVTQIKDYHDTHEGGGGGGQNTKYSTVEQVIGTWIDGKPLYQKTIYKEAVNLPSGGGNVTIETITNLNCDTVMFKCGSFYDTYNADQFSLPLWHVSYPIYIMVNRHTIGLYAVSVYYSNPTRLTKVSVTIQYTKTTD